MKKTIYLAGGIAGLDAEEVYARFTSYKTALENLGLEVLSPIRGKVLDAEVSGKYEVNEIVDRDLDDIQNSDLLISQPSEKSIGSWMEIFFAAYVRHIPVIVVTTNPFIAKHYWTRKFATKIVPTIEDAITYIQKWFL